MSCVGDHFEKRGSSCEPPPPCPDVRPALGVACSAIGFGPSRCNYYDTCGDRPYGYGTPYSDTLSCSGGRWTLVSDDYVATCPKDPPMGGAPCLCGIHHYGDCSYGDCYGTPTTTARCDASTGRWTVLPSTCNPPPPDDDAGPPDVGFSDAGSGG